MSMPGSSGIASQNETKPNANDTSFLNLSQINTTAGDASLLGLNDSNCSFFANSQQDSNPAVTTPVNSNRSRNSLAPRSLSPTPGSPVRKSREDHLAACFGGSFYDGCPGTPYKRKAERFFHCDRSIGTYNFEILLWRLEEFTLLFILLNFKFHQISKVSTEESTAKKNQLLVH